jgi:chemotaxis protein methyltransferase CheR
MKARLKFLGQEPLQANGWCLDWYQRKLEKGDALEWKAIDSMFSINITRFLRDQNVFSFIQNYCYPRMVAVKESRKDASVVRIWSCGCSSGEEVWTLKILASVGLDKPIAMDIFGTDIHSEVIQTATKASYTLTETSTDKMPREWLEQAVTITKVKGHQAYSIRPELRKNVQFAVQDVRKGMPKGPFHMISSRHAVFMYFDMEQRAKVLERMLKILTPGGFLVTGANDRLPPNVSILSTSFTCC